MTDEGNQGQPQHDIDVKVLIEEYKEVNANLRHYGNMRFAQLTLHYVLTGGLLSKSLSFDPLNEWLNRVAIPIAGMVVSICFLILEERCTDWWVYFRQRAEEIEPLLFIAQFSTPRPRKRFNATNSVRTLFVLTIVAWLLVVLQYFIQTKPSPSHLLQDVRGVAYEIFAWSNPGSLAEALTSCHVCV